MRKKDAVILVWSVMSLYEGAKIRVRLDSELSDEFEVKVGMLCVVSFPFCNCGRCCH